MNLKKRFIALFDNSGFRGPVLKLLSGTGITFVIGYLAKPVLLRLFSAEDIGIWGLIIAIVGIATPLASMRYEDALMLPEDRRKSAHAFLLAWAILLLVCALLFLALPFRDHIAGMFKAESAGIWLWLVPIVLFVNRGTKITEVWLSRHEQFARISAGQVLHTSSMTGVRLAAGFLSPGPGGYVGGFIAGYLIALGSYAKKTITTVSDALSSPPTWMELKDVLVRYRRFPLFTVPAAIVSALIMRLPMLMIFREFGADTSGLYSEAFNNILVPLSLIAAAVAQVYYVRAVEARRAGTLAQITDNVHRRLVLLGLFPVACLMISGPDVFDFLFGDNSDWRTAGGFILYIGPLILFSIIASPLTRLFDVLERQRLEFATATIMLAVLAGALFIARATGDIYVFLTWLGVAGTGIRLGQLAVILRLAGVSWRRMAAPYLRYGLHTAPLLLMVWLGVHTLAPLGATLTTILAFILYGLYLLLQERLLAHRAP